MKLLKVLAPYTRKELEVVDTRPNHHPHPHCHASHWPKPFEVQRRISHNPPSMVIVPVPHSYLAAKDAVGAVLHAQRKELDLMYLDILTGIEDAATAKEIETLLDKAGDKEFTIPDTVSPELTLSIQAYHDALTMHFLCVPVLTLVPKNNTKREVDFGLFYGLPGDQPFEIDFQIQP